MGNKIKFKRGKRTNLPNLDYGEPAFVSDEKELYIGTGTENIKLTHKKEIEALTSQLNIIGCIPQLFGAKADNKTDDTKAIQDAIDFAKSQGINRVYIPAGTYVITTLLIPEFFTLEGVGRGSKLRQTNSATSDIIKFKQGSCFSTIRGLKLEGCYDTAKPVRHGICLTDYVDETGYFDSCNTIENVYISDVTGDGIYVGWNQRGARLENIDITRCNKAGIRLHGSDNIIMNCNPSVCREPDIMNDWGGWNNRYIGCKGFHAGVDHTATNVSPTTYMMRILGNCNNVLSDLQESVGGALQLQGNTNKLDLMIDGCGKKSYETGIETTVIKIDVGSIGNNIRATILDGTLNGYAKYLLDISPTAFSNIIDITFRQSGDVDKRQKIQISKTPYHFSNIVRVNGVTYKPVLYKNRNFTSMNASDGTNLLWNTVTNENNSYSVVINKSMDAVNQNGWMYICLNNKETNEFVVEAKKHNNGVIQFEFDFETNVKISSDYVIDLIIFANGTITTDVSQRWTTQGKIYMTVPCKIAADAKEFNIAIGIRRMTNTTNNMPATTSMKISNLKIGFGEFVEDI